MQTVLAEIDPLLFLKKLPLNLKSQLLEQHVEIVEESKVDFALLQTSDTPN